MSAFGEALTRLMAERKMGVNALARRSHYTAGYISNLRHGKRRPAPEAAAELDAILDADGELITLVPAPELAAGAPEATVPSIAVSGGDIGLIELARRAEASDVGSRTIKLLQEAADRLCRDYPVVDPGVLSARARGHLRYVTDLLGKRVTLTQHRDLLVTAGWLSALLACTLFDAGDPSAAETARTMTRQFGEHAAHGELIAWSFEIAAWYALTEGRFPQAAALSEAGLAHAAVSNAAVQLTLQAARAYARMGDDQAVKMLADGQAILSRLSVSEHPEHHFVFDRDKFEFYTATIYTWLGTDDRAAEENVREVVTRSLGLSVYPMRLGNARIDLGIIAGRHGNLDEAVANGRLALGPERRSAQLLPRAIELKRRLAARYGRERLVDEYSAILHEEFRVMPPAAAQLLDEAIERRLDGGAA